MANLLKDIDVTFISLVRKGANKKTIIFKSAEEAEDLKEIEIKKFDNKKGIVYGIVYAPDEVDTQGDLAKADEIEKASQNFMRNLSNHNVDKQHSFEKEDAFVSESWIVRKNDELFPDEKQGAWAVAIKVESDELKKEIEDGNITGLSMAGSAKRIKKSDNEDDLLTKIRNLFKKENNMDGKEVQAMIDESITKAVEGLPKQQTPEELAVVIKSALDALDLNKGLDELKETVEKMSKENSGSIQTEISKDELAKCDEEGEAIAKHIRQLQGTEKEGDK